MLDNGVNTRLGILINLVEADIVLAVAGVGKLRHCESAVCTLMGARSQWTAEVN